MKRNRLIFSLLLLFGVSQINAQSPAIWSFYHGASRNESTVKFTVPGLAVKLGALFIKETETRRLVKKLGKVRLFVVEDQKDFINKKEAGRFVKRLRRDGFEDFIAVKEKDTDVHLMVRERRDKIKGVVIMVKDDGDFVLITAKCNLSAKDLMSFFNDHSDKLIKEAKKQKRNATNS